MSPVENQSALPLIDVPSALTTLMICMIGVPAVARLPVTVTSSPTLKVSLVMPRASDEEIDANSPTHRTGLPLSSFTSQKKRTCGLRHRYSATTPFSWTGLSLGLNPG